MESANDVAVMIAEGVAGSQEAFAQCMNETARLTALKCRALTPLKIISLFRRLFGLRKRASVLVPRRSDFRAKDPSRGAPRIVPVRPAA